MLTNLQIRETPFAAYYGKPPTMSLKFTSSSIGLRCYSETFTLSGIFGSAPFSSKCSTMMENPLPQGFRRAVEPSCGQKVRNDVMVNSECMLCMVVML